ncbi:MAG: SDR family NAD(P)-dependent oxidoreductase [Gammaproteobacteria bacterium]|jgi:NAD(P)-dependent dehydrogenase (short-subunit alcohol dehydrogenase family)|nr:SDR family NAD(P)-dependent oxidoreductase [Gammaproteobacteria bacterium]|tara:strand:- start:2656 stop:3438 length:783 start_codon:yes stop_codon:yes gene_type:complete
MLSFSGKNILVTGAGSGIGKATALLLGQQNAGIIVVDQHQETALQTTEELKELGVRAIFVVANISDAAAVDQMYASTMENFKTLDGIVHCAGIGIERTLMEMTREEWDRIIAVNLTGTFLCAQGAAKIMVKQRYGRIVLMGSAAGERGGTGRTAYGASKGGVSAITRVMAVELAELGITVNALAPGAIETELVSRMHDAETREAYCSRIPVNRYGTPEEVAATAVFLVSEEAGYINGVVMPVDGGFMGGGVIKRKANPKG